MKDRNQSGVIESKTPKANISRKSISLSANQSKRRKHQSMASIIHQLPIEEISKSASGLKWKEIGEKKKKKKNEISKREINENERARHRNEMKYQSAWLPRKSAEEAWNISPENEMKEGEAHQNFGIIIEKKKKTLISESGVISRETLRKIKPKKLHRNIGERAGYIMKRKREIRNENLWKHQPRYRKRNQKKRGIIENIPLHRRK